MWVKYMNDIEKKINEVLDRLRPYLNNDGGDVTFLRYQDGIVYVKLVGACSNCPHATMTLKEGIEMAIIEEVTNILNKAEDKSIKEIVR